jgi:hypothetical protein
MRDLFFASLFASLLFAALPQFLFAQRQPQDPGREAPPQERPQPRPAPAPEKEKPGKSGEFASVRSGTKLTAELESNVDASKAKPGDEVTARVTKDVKQDGKVVIRKGDRLAGRITEVRSTASGEASSKLAVAFDRLVRGDAEHQLNTVVTSVISALGEKRAREPQMDREPMTPPSAPRGGSASSSGGLLGSTTSTVGATAGSLGSGVSATTSGAIGAADSTARTAGGSVEATSRTAVGSTTGAALATPRNAIRLDSQAGAQNRTGVNSVLSSREGNLRLESGTRLEFRVESEAQAQTN